MEQLPARKELALDSLQLKKAAMMLRAINHPLRLQMLQLIHKKRNITVTEIYVQLRLEQSVASQHLAILRKAGFVFTERSGKQIFYSVNFPWLKEVQALAGQLFV